MVETCGTTLEEREDEHDAQLTRQCSVLLGAGPRDGLCLVEDVDVLRLAEVEAIVQLLQDDELGALGCDLTNGGL